MIKIRWWICVCNNKRAGGDDYRKGERPIHSSGWSAHIIPHTHTHIHTSISPPRWIAEDNLPPSPFEEGEGDGIEGERGRGAFPARWMQSWLPPRPIWISNGQHFFLCDDKEGEEEEEEEEEEEKEKKFFLNSFGIVFFLSFLILLLLFPLYLFYSINVVDIFVFSYIL